MHHVKNHGNKEIPLAKLSRILLQSCATLCLNIHVCRERLCMIVLVSLIVIVKPDFLVSTIFHTVNPYMYMYIPHSFT